jgi:hypothetical protein
METQMSDPAADDLLGLGEGMAPAVGKGALPEDLAAMLPEAADPEQSDGLDLSDPELQALIEEYQALSEGLAPLPSGARSPKWDKFEAQFLDPSSSASITEIAASFNVAENSAYRISKIRKWMERKRVLFQIAQKTNALSIGEAASVAAQVPLGMQSQEDQELRMLAMVDRAMLVWDKCLDAGKIQFKTAKDLDIMVRLVAFIQGRAERIIEQRHRLSPKDFEKIVARVQKRHRWSPKQAGVIQDAEFTMVDEVSEVPATTAPHPASSLATPDGSPDSSDVPHGTGQPEPSPQSASPPEGDRGPSESEGSDSPTPEGETSRPGTTLGRALVRAGTLRLRPPRAPAPTPPTPANPVTAAPTE